jgi:hypothetical protein
VYTQHNGKNIPVSGGGLQCGMQGTCHQRGIIRSMNRAAYPVSIVFGPVPREAV